MGQDVSDGDAGVAGRIEIDFDLASSNLLGCGAVEAEFADGERLAAEVEGWTEGPAGDGPPGVQVARLSVGIESGTGLVFVFPILASALPDSDGEGGIDEAQALAETA